MNTTDEQTPIRERWTAQAPGIGDEEIAGALLRLAAQPPPIGDLKLAEIRARLRSSKQADSRAVARPSWPLLRKVVVAAGLVLLGGTISATVLHVRYRTPGNPTPVVRPALEPRQSNPTSIQRDELAREDHHEIGYPQPARRKSAVKRAARLHASDQSSAKAGEGLLEQQSKLLAVAIAKLRRDGEPQQALDILDQHATQLGAGTLSREATAIRIEALVRLGRNMQALALLDARTLSARGVDREMLVARAELRASDGRCSAALSDFDRLLLGKGPADSVTERARYGRASCRAKIGDWDGARSDFQQYLGDFPNGRFAAQARMALAPRTP